MTLRELRLFLARLDPGALHPTRWFLEQLDEAEVPRSMSEPATTDPDAPWTERLWTVPPETRMGLEQVAEACGRSMSWVYQRSGPSCDPELRLPVRAHDGRKVVTAGDLRVWLRAQEV